MIGKKLSNRYEITGELGRGGMGVVYRARDPLLDREVAVKLIPPTMLNPETEQRFQHEAKLVAQIYSLGVVLYECVVGQPPFTGDVQSILYRIVNEFLQPPRAVGASNDEEFERLILD